MGLFEKRSVRNRKWFDEQAKRFFDDGLMYEIYSSDRLCICNIANQCYGVFGFSRSKLGPLGMYINPDMVMKIIEDKNYLYRLTDSDRSKYTSLAIILDDSRYAIFRKFKDRNALLGPSSDIDPELEAKARAMMKGI